MLTLPDGRTIPIEEFDPHTMILSSIWSYLGGQQLTCHAWEELIADGFSVSKPWEIGEDFIILERGERWAMIGITPDLAVALTRGCTA